MDRRAFLNIVGGGVIVSATPGCAILQPTPKQALTPWLSAGTNYSEPRRKALSYAILCPNPHNRQPWKVDLSVENQVILFVDTDRLLPHTDPFGRQITIGLGCFTELMVMAAAADGWEVEIDVFPDGEDTTRLLDSRPVVVARFSKNEITETDPLFQQVRFRHSLNTPFDTTKTVPQTVMDKAIDVAIHGSQVMGSNDPAMVKTLRNLTHESLSIELDTPRTYKESVDLFRIGKKEINRNPDGIDFSGRTFEILSLFGMFSRKVALDPESSGYKQGRAAVLENTTTAMAHLWVVTPTNTRLDQINVGRDWVRINLSTTASGVGLHPLSQILQEYPEMKSLYTEIHQLLAADGGTVQMLARMGYGKPENRSPRWPIDAKLVGESA